jgi:hypothetical protein
MMRRTRGAGAIGRVAALFPSRVAIGVVVGPIAVAMVEIALVAVVGRPAGIAASAVVAGRAAEVVSAHTAVVAGLAITGRGGPVVRARVRPAIADVAALLGRAQEVAAAALATTIAITLRIVVSRVAAARGVVASVPVEIAIRLDVEAAFAIIPSLRHGSSPWRSEKLRARRGAPAGKTERAETVFLMPSLRYPQTRQTCGRPALRPISAPPRFTMMRVHRSAPALNAFRRPLPRRTEVPPSPVRRRRQDGEAAAAGARICGAVAVHQGEEPVVFRQRREGLLPLLLQRQARRHHQLPAGDRAADLRRGGRAAGVRGRHEPARGRPARGSRGAEALEPRRLDGAGRRLVRERAAPPGRQGRSRLSGKARPARERVGALPRRLRAQQSHGPEGLSDRQGRQAGRPGRRRGADRAGGRRPAL